MFDPLCYFSFWGEDLKIFLLRVLNLYSLSYSISIYWVPDTVLEFEDAKIKKSWFLFLRGPRSNLINKTGMGSFQKLSRPHQKVLTQSLGGGSFRLSPGLEGLPPEDKNHKGRSLGLSDHLHILPRALRPHLQCSGMTPPSLNPLQHKGECWARNLKARVWVPALSLIR